MRDPTERYLSQQRMQLRKMGRLRPEHESDYLREASIKLHKRNCLRSNYPETIDSLRSGLKTNEIFRTYETMFSDSEHNSLCKFLKIKTEKPNTSERINASPATTRVPDDVMVRLGKHFAPLVEAVDTRCPDLKVKEHWKTTQKWSETISITTRHYLNKQDPDSFEHKRQRKQNEENPSHHPSARSIINNLLISVALLTNSITEKNMTLTIKTWT
ncbi:MAG: hypothetical protein CM15mP116_00110 [Synechococcus sp.]|nr:MAG: hypothetical protein CM15mP116_00110 [Synechococcus sp.]